MKKIVNRYVANLYAVGLGDGWCEIIETDGVNNEKGYGKYFILEKNILSPLKNDIVIILKK